MRYYRCKCGNAEAWGSLGAPARCVVCHDCNSTLSSSPEYHAEPAEHEWTTQYDPNTGTPFKVCRNCYEQENAPKDSK